MVATPLPVGDHPIDNPDEDVLGRDVVAAALADELLTIDASQGVVAAITGPWGTGKTSLLNLTARRLRSAEGVRVVDFNPWLFSGAEELASAFLGELARELRHLEPARRRWRRRSAGVADTVAEYSAALYAVGFIPGAASARQALHGLGKRTASQLRGDTSLNARRDAAVDALSRLDGRVVVLVDDIDRLTRDELRHLFRMVRLTASFPNVVYLLSLDRKVVAEALSDAGFAGGEYLEKILSLTCAVPTGQPEVFRAAWLDSLNALLEQHPVGPIDEDAFGRVQLQILDPLMRTLRDAKRVLTSLPVAMRTAGSEVAFADLVALESLRVLAPDLHAALPDCSRAFTTLRDNYLPQQDKEHGDRVSRFVAADVRHDGKVARAVVEVLFPAAAHHLGGATWAAGSSTAWRRERRVADVGVLEYYLSRQLAPGVASRARLDRIVQDLATLDSGRMALAAVPDEELENVLEQLTPFAETAPPSLVPAAVEVLLEQFPRLRTDVRGMMDFGAEFAITRPVLRLLRQVDSTQVMAVADRLVGITPTVFAAFELVTLVGHRENAGHRLVGADEARDLEQKLRQRLETAAPADIAAERRLTRLLFHTLLPPENATEPALPALLDKQVLAAVLVDGVAVSRSQVIGSTEVTLGYSLHWDILVRLYGGDERLLRCVDELRSELADADVPEPLQRALELVERYRTGWRPDEFGRG